MPRKPLGDRPMSNAERQARHRAVRAAALPVIHYRRADDHRRRARRWRDAVAVLLTLQAEYRAWLQALPDSLQEGATAPDPTPRVAQVGKQAPPARAAPSLVRALRVARGSPLFATWTTLVQRRLG